MTCLKILYGQSFVEQHALPGGLESHLLVAIPALPLPVSRVALPCNQVVVVEVGGGGGGGVIVVVRYKSSTVRCLQHLFRKTALN